MQLLRHKFLSGCIDYFIDPTGASTTMTMPPAYTNSTVRDEAKAQLMNDYRYVDNSAR